MHKVLLQISMSLDGFITGPYVGVQHPIGRGGRAAARDQALASMSPRPSGRLLEEAG
jgi:hypothetical protein